MRLSGSEEILAGALTDLNKKWDNTALGWRDKARTEFEKEYLDELQLTAKKALQGMAALDELLAHVMRECG